MSAGGGEASDDPVLAYYTACEGRWRCPLALEVTDRSALRATYGWWLGNGFALLARWPRWLGRMWLATSVSRTGDRSFRHTTRVLWLGALPMMWGEEELVLGDDGVSVSLSGWTRFATMPWRRFVARGSGLTDTSGTHTTYELEWLGAGLTQTGTRTPDGVTLSQTTDGFSSTHPLRRRGD